MMVEMEDVVVTIAMMVMRRRFINEVRNPLFIFSSNDCVQTYWYIARVLDCRRGVKSARCSAIF